MRSPVRGVRRPAVNQRHQISQPSKHVRRCLCARIGSNQESQDGFEVEAVAGWRRFGGIGKRIKGELSAAISYSVGTGEPSPSRSSTGFFVEAYRHETHNASATKDSGI